MFRVLSSTGLFPCNIQNSVTSSSWLLRNHQRPCFPDCCSQRLGADEERSNITSSCMAAIASSAASEEELPFRHSGGRFKVSNRVPALLGVKSVGTSVSPRGDRRA